MIINAKRKRKRANHSPHLQGEITAIEIPAMVAGSVGRNPMVGVSALKIIAGLGKI